MRVDRPVGGAHHCYLAGVVNMTRYGGTVQVEHYFYLFSVYIRCCRPAKLFSWKRAMACRSLFVLTSTMHWALFSGIE